MCVAVCCSVLQCVLRRATSSFCSKCFSARSTRSVQVSKSVMHAGLVLQCVLQCMLQCVAMCAVPRHV